MGKEQLKLKAMHALVLFQALQLRVQSCVGRGREV
jgi:hypothetical protein